MIRVGFSSLKSRGLAAYAVPFPCYVCMSDNPASAELCGNCMAPMAISHHAGKTNTRQKFISILGESGAGKSVYLGTLLDSISRQPRDIQVLARGAYSISLQQSTLSALQECRFPPPTSKDPGEWGWVHCQAKIAWHKHAKDLVLPDSPGFAQLEEASHPNSFPSIRGCMRNSDGCLLMLDAAKLATASRETDYLALKLVTSLMELHNGKRKSWGKRPFAVVLTKCDMVPDSQADPVSFLYTHAVGLWRMLRSRCPRSAVFATSVAGAIGIYDARKGGVVRVPLRIEPVGILQPFLWLLDNMT